MNTNTFAVIGGDFRTVFTANELAALGYRVKIFGFHENTVLSEAVERGCSLKQTLENAKYILLPLPCIVDGETISAMLYDKKIYIKDVVDAISNDSVVFAGKMDKIVQAMLEIKSIQYYDYFEREEFIVANAIPTAEGAIEIALKEMPITLHNANCLILGFGRISKVLAKMLQGFGTNVFVAARKPSDLTWGDAYGYNVMYMNTITSRINEFDVVFNTVPKILITRDILQNAKKDCLIIDLASKPGGVDFDAAQSLGLNVIWALSLPGKVAPITAGSILKDTILNIIREMEVE